MRHPIELAIQQVLPLQAKPEVTPEDAASVSRPFALLLSEAEAVHDHVRLSLAVQGVRGGQMSSAAMMAVGPLSTLRDSMVPLRDAWSFLCARMPWGGVVGLQAQGAPRRRSLRRR